MFVCETHTNECLENNRQFAQRRDVRYEKIPVSAYRKKYTGNTGIPVFWPCKKLNFIGSSESCNGRKIPKH